MDLNKLALLATELDHAEEVTIWHIVHGKMCVTVSPSVHECRDDAKLDLQEEGIPNLCIPYYDYFDFEGAENSEPSQDLIIPLSQIVMIRVQTVEPGIDATTPCDAMYWARDGRGVLQHFQESYEYGDVTP